MYRFRKEDSSIYLYLQNFVLSEFIEYQEQDTLKYSKILSSGLMKDYSILTDLEPNPFSRGRGLVYLDDLTEDILISDDTFYAFVEQSQRVVVYDNYQNIIDENSYMVNYLAGKIAIDAAIVPSYIDYYWNYVSLVDDWSYALASKAPVVVLEVDGFEKTGYQLGAGKKTTRKGSLTVFAASSAERKDITEVLYDGLYLKSCACYDLANGSILDYEGYFSGRKSNMDKSSNQFLRTTVSGLSRLQFENVVAKNIILPSVTTGNNQVTLADLNKFRSRITFDIISYSTF